MNTSNSEYLLLFRGSDWCCDLSPAELQEAMSKVRQWFEGLAAKGVMKAAQPLQDEGRIVSRNNAGTVADGPFVESKEAVGGYLLITVGSLEEAVAIARQCPTIQFGAEVEVRPIAQECPHMKRAGQSMTGELASATA